MPSVVFDTSVLIPLILPASWSTRLFLRLEAASWQIVVSPQILDETREKMKTKRSTRRWLKLSDAEIDRFLDVILPGKTRHVPGVLQAPGAVPPDHKDDKIIAAALESQATYIVSEDKHLLDLKQYDGITIMNRDEFERELDRLGVPR
jgi:putative PIN family toxin of toxin-antitoxin system